MEQSRYKANTGSRYQINCPLFSKPKTPLPRSQRPTIGRPPVVNLVLTAQINMPNIYFNIILNLQT